MNDTPQYRYRVYINNSSYVDMLSPLPFMDLIRTVRSDGYCMSNAFWIPERWISTIAPLATDADLPSNVTPLFRTP